MATISTWKEYFCQSDIIGKGDKISPATMNTLNNAINSRRADAGMSSAQLHPWTKGDKVPVDWIQQWRHQVLKLIQSGHFLNPDTGSAWASNTEFFNLVLGQPYFTDPHIATGGNKWKPEWFNEVYKSILALSITSRRVIVAPTGASGRILYSFSNNPNAWVSWQEGGFDVNFLAAYDGFILESGPIGSASPDPFITVGYEGASTAQWDFSNFPGPSIQTTPGALNINAAYRRHLIIYDSGYNKGSLDTKAVKYAFANIKAVAYYRQEQASLVPDTWNVTTLQNQINLNFHEGTVFSIGSVRESLRDGNLGSKAGDASLIVPNVSFVSNTLQIADSNFPPDPSQTSLTIITAGNEYTAQGIGYWGGVLVVVDDDSKSGNVVDPDSGLPKTTFQDIFGSPYYRGKNNARRYTKLERPTITVLLGPSFSPF